MRFNHFTAPLHSNKDGLRQVIINKTWNKG